MTKLRWILLGIVVLVGLAFLIPSSRVRILSLVRGEPVYAGRLLSDWQAELEQEHAAGQGKNGPAYQQLAKGGKEAAPIIMVLAFRTPPTPGADMLLVDLGVDAVPGLTNQMKSGSPVNRLVAAKILGSMGEKGQAAALELGSAALDPDPKMAQEALAALLAIGPSAGVALPELKQLLAKGGPQQQAQAAQILKNLGPEGKSALPQLLALLEAPVSDFHVGRRAAEALAKMGPEVVAPLRDALRKSLSAQARGCAAIALGEMGSEAKPAVLDLAASLKDQDSFVNIHAATALGKLGPMALPALKDLGAAIMDKNGPKYHAVVAVGNIGPPAAEATPVLIEALKVDPASDVPQAARDALEKIGPSAHQATAELVRRFKDKAPIDKFGEPALPHLLALLADAPKDDATAQAATKFAQDLLASSPQAILDAAQDKNPALRRVALSFMQPSHKKADQFLPVLVKSLNDAEAQVRAEAQSVLKGYGAALDPFLEKILQGKDQALKTAALPLARSDRVNKIVLNTLQDEDKKETPQVRRQAAVHLARQGIFPKASLPLFLEMLEDPKVEAADKISILSWFGPYGREARPLLPLLLKHVKIGDPSPAAKKAFASVASIAVSKETLPLLLAAAQEKDPDYRRPALVALGKAAFDAEPATARLAEHLQAEDLLDTFAALESLEKLGPGAKGAMAQVVKLVRQPVKTSDVQVRALRAFIAMKAGASEALPILAEVLEKWDDPQVLALAAGALGKFGPDAKESLKLLDRLPEPLTPEAALARYRITGDNKYFDALVADLQGKHAAGAAQALSQLGVGSRSALKPLLNLLRSTKDEAARIGAMKALVALDDPLAKQALPLMLADLKYGSETLKIAAAESLARFGDAAAAAVATLVDLANDWRSPRLREAAGTALLRIDAEAAEQAGVLNN